MKIIALDLSLTSTGVCLPDGQTLIIHTKLRGMARLARIRSDIVDLLGAYCPRIVAIEGYAHNKHQGAVYLGELGGVVRLALYERGYPWVDIPPKCRVKYSTGNGNSSKDAVLSAAVHRSGREIPSNDEADAWWLHQMTLAHYAPGHPLLVAMPKINHEGLVKIDWPEVT